MNSSINYLAVLVAGCIPMVLGAVWYGPLFGKRWMELVGKTEEQLKEGFNPAKTYGITFAFALLMAYVLAHVLAAFSFANGASGIFAGIEAGFWVWLGFVLTIGWQQVAFNDQHLTLWILNVLFNLVSLICMGALLGVWN